MRAKSDILAVVKLFALFAPVAFVVFAEHIANHKNLGSIIDRDLIKDPGLPRTLLGDGVAKSTESFMLNIVSFRPEVTHPVTVSVSIKIRFKIESAPIGSESTL